MSRHIAAGNGGEHVLIRGALLIRGPKVKLESLQGKDCLASVKCEMPSAMYLRYDLGLSISIVRNPTCPSPME